MQIFAIAGGAGPGDEAALGCCFVFPLMPLVVILAGLGAYRYRMWPAAIALILGGVPYLALRSMIASYQQWDDWEIMEDQATGLRVVGWYIWLVGIAGASVLYVGCRKLISWGRSGCPWNFPS